MDHRNELTTVYPKGSGLQADGYLLFVDSQNTGSCLDPSTNAYASSCQMDPKTDRGESIKPYCDKPNTVTCRDLYTYGLCGVTEFPLPLPPADQFFGPEAGANYARLGGNDPFKDKCPTLGYTCKSGGDIDIDFSGQTVTCARGERDKTAKFDLDGKNYEVNIRCPDANVLCNRELVHGCLLVQEADLSNTVQSSKSHRT
uniref:Leishmanolysin-like peptidase n=1 Tax=Trichobilharzia regenti TaxID=157069 RepID=A0AA85KLP4_TRIRE|nr:unnamed protein product [Trichobilharzia regenti]